MKKKHLWYYISLGLIYIIGLYLLIIFQYSKQTQMIILVMLAFFYIGLGVLHHAIHHIVSAKIVIEYVSLATLGIAVAFFILQSVI